MSEEKKKSPYLIKTSNIQKVTQWKGKSREEKRHQDMLSKIKKLQKNNQSFS
ncbi:MULTISPECIES: hypothetical protein [Gracilibacillus]|uniref:hypothetical protein n=1 Tax=Gracilibacillus TaxID=74385 RepID=UPI000A91A4B6|nr:hypothetical protein [Gracilibacillus dipsosauri]